MYKTVRCSVQRTSYNGTTCTSGYKSRVRLHPCHILAQNARHRIRSWGGGRGGETCEFCYVIVTMLTGYYPPPTHAALPPSSTPGTHTSLPHFRPAACQGAVTHVRHIAFNAGLRRGGVFVMPRGRARPPPARRRVCLHSARG